MYNIIVKVKNDKGHYIWEAVHPTGEPPYTVSTERDAVEFANKWYPFLIYGQDIKSRKVENITSGD